MLSTSRTDPSRKILRETEEANASCGVRVRNLSRHRTGAHGTFVMRDIPSYWGRIVLHQSPQHRTGLRTVRELISWQPSGQPDRRFIQCRLDLLEQHVVFGLPLLAAQLREQPVGNHDAVLGEFQVLFAIGLGTHVRPRIRSNSTAAL